MVRSMQPSVHSFHVITPPLSVSYRQSSNVNYSYLQSCTHPCHCHVLAPFYHAPPLILATLLRSNMHQSNHIILYSHVHTPSYVVFDAALIVYSHHSCFHYHYRHQPVTVMCMYICMYGITCSNHDVISYILIWFHFVW